MEQDKIRRRKWQNVYILGKTGVREAQSRIGVGPDEAEVPAKNDLRMPHSWYLHNGHLPAPNPLSGNGIRMKKNLAKIARRGRVIYDPLCSTLKQI